MKAKRKSKKQSTKPKAKAKGKKVSGKLLDKNQELFYYGAPPAIKMLYKTNTGYDPKFHPQDFLIQLQQGHSPDEVAASWGISGHTLSQWIDAYAELAEARAVGATAFSGYYKKSLRLSAFGQLKTVNEKSLFKILDNQLGFNDLTGGHEFADTQGADVVFVDGEGKEI